MRKTIPFTLIALLFLSQFSFAQKAKVLSMLDILENSQADVMYYNEFGQFVNNELDDPFPYSVVRVELEGDEGADVREAKERMALDLGTQYAVQSVVKNKPNCMLFLVPRGVKAIYLLCSDGCPKQLLHSGEAMRSNKVYVCKVHYKREQSSSGGVVPVVPTSEYLVIKVKPEDAMVEIDDVIVETEDGIAMKKLSFGNHTYRVSAPNYHPESGAVTLNASSSKVEKYVELVPAFGWIKINSNQSNIGASVYIDSKMSGHIPFVSEGLPSGAHDVRVVRDKYNPFRQQVDVRDGDTSELLPVLAANFSSIPFKVDGNAEIWTNDEKIGQGNCTIDLTPGEYVIETRKKSHVTQSKVINVQLGVANPVSLPAPIPICGTIDVSSRPLNSQVFLDGKPVGTTPLLLSNVLIGRHYVQIKSDGKENLEKYVDVKEGEIVTVSESLQERKVEQSYNSYKSYSESSGNSRNQVSHKLTYSYGDYRLDGMILSKYEVENLYRRYCPAEYRVYKNAKATFVAGEVFLTISTLSALTGIVCAIPESTKTIGVGLMSGSLVMGLCLVTPLMACSHPSAKWDNCMKAYNNRYYSASNSESKVTLNLQVSRDGLGLALSF